MSCRTIFKPILLQNDTPFLPKPKFMIAKNMSTNNAIITPCMSI